MVTTNSLLDLYEEWKALTLNEARAIQHSDWEETLLLQGAKRELQPRILRWTEHARASCEDDHQKQTLDGAIRQVVNALIWLERENSALVKDRLASCKDSRQQLDQASKRLRQVHQSYVPARAAVWTQYS